ncbi:MAG: single-stranded DNA-binding protein [Gammaproteobacteria bacterium AqS3]|nr:single-stranded DNA-binding protein [Gammaproteobacteria bacterium AqS3]
MARRGINKVILVGNLGADPDERKLSEGEGSVTRISVATSEQYTKRDGTSEERTEWHRVVFFGRLAEVAAQYLRRGSKVYIEGSLRTDKYVDRDGITRWSTEIRGREMQMLDSRQSGSQDHGAGQPAQSQYGSNNAQPAAPPAAAPAASGGKENPQWHDDDVPM